MKISSSVSLLSALLSVSATESSFATKHVSHQEDLDEQPNPQRRRKTVLAIDDMMEETSSILDHDGQLVGLRRRREQNWKRNLKDSKKKSSKKGKSSKRDSSSNSIKSTKETKADATTGKTPKQPLVSKAAAHHSLSTRKAGGGSGPSIQNDYLRLGDGIVDEVMAEVFAMDLDMMSMSMGDGIGMSMDMSMSMPSTSPEPEPTTPSPTPGSATDEPTKAPVEEETCEDLPRASVLFELCAEITDVDVLSDPSTPQNKAYEWLVNDDSLQIDPCTYPTVQQRYALATFYFSTNGDNWVDNGGWMSASQECEDWLGIDCNDETGQVVFLYLGKCIGQGLMLSFVLSFLVWMFF